MINAAKPCAFFFATIITESKTGIQSQKLKFEESKWGCYYELINQNK